MTVARGLLGAILALQCLGCVASKGLRATPGLSKVEAAESALAEGDEAAASRSLDRALRVLPEGDPELGERAGRVAFALGRTEQALELWRRAASKPDAPPEALYNVAVAAAALGNRVEAVFALTRFLEVQPGEVDALLWLGRLLLEAGRDFEAVEVLELVLDLSPRDLPAYETLAAAYYQTGQLERADETLVLALAFAPESARLRKSLGLVAEADGRRDDALWHYAQALERSPADLEAQRALRRLRSARED